MVVFIDQHLAIWFKAQILFHFGATSFIMTPKAGTTAIWFPHKKDITSTV